MPRKKAAIVAPINDVGSLIYVVRGQRVMLDSNLAELYGVPTSALNQAVERNPDRFPDDFSFPLTRQEFMDLISQTVISNAGRGGRRKLPRVFTEHGVAMLSSVLRSPLAAAVNIEIVRAFIRMRRLMVTPADLVEQIRQLQETVQIHDEQIRWAIDALQHLMPAPPDQEPKRRIGFHSTEQAPAE
jgi:hypothetical protein